MRARHKSWAVPYLEEHPEVAIHNLEGLDDFLSLSPLFLEIGSGKGDFAISMCKRCKSYLALERELSVCGIMAKKVVESGATNIKLLPMDLDEAYEEIKSLRFDVVFLNFSDPWPKKRHWKRRLTERERLKKIFSLVKDGGELRIKTDNDDLYEFTKEEAASIGLNCIYDEFDYRFDEENDSMSEYERNFREQGKKIHRLIYK